jgi:TRAP-type C4-dicarboxylate transport system permease small subunit
MKRIINSFNKIEAFIGGTFLCAMLVLLAGQVILRWAGASNSWSEEIARYMFVWLVYVGGSLAAAERAHITITIASRIWPKRIRPYALILGTVAWIILSAILSYYAFDFAWRLYINKTVSLGLEVNMFWPYFGLALGYSLMTIRIVQYQLIPDIKKLFSTKDNNLTEGGNLA